MLVGRGEASEAADGRNVIKLLRSAWVSVKVELGADKR